MLLDQASLHSPDLAPRGEVIKTWEKVVDHLVDSPHSARWVTVRKARERYAALGGRSRLVHAGARVRALVHPTPSVAEVEGIPMAAMIQQRGKWVRYGRGWMGGWVDGGGSGGGWE